MDDTPQQHIRRLNEKEHFVLLCMTKGMGNKQIATELGCSRRMIEKYCTRVYEKLNVQCRAQAIALAVRFSELDE
jgi:NarL family two-component system response regulator YdfI